MHLPAGPVSFHWCLPTVAGREDGTALRPTNTQDARGHGRWAEGLGVPCTTKFTACRSACARSRWSRAWTLGSGLLLPMTDATKPGSHEEKQDMRQE